MVQKKRFNSEQAAERLALRIEESYVASNSAMAALLSDQPLQPNCVNILQKMIVSYGESARQQLSTMLSYKLMHSKNCKHFCLDSRTKIDIETSGGENLESIWSLGCKVPQMPEPTPWVVIYIDFKSKDYKFSNGLVDWCKLTMRLLSTLDVKFSIDVFYFSTTCFCEIKNVFVLALLLQIAVVSEFEKKVTNDFHHVFYYYRQLVALDALKVCSSFRERSYLEYASSVIGSIVQKENRWDKLDPLYCEAILEAVQLWDNDDERWHYQIVDYLLDKYNGPIVGEIESDLKVKYPDRRTVSGKMKYEKERKSRVSKETMTKVKLVSLLKDTAIKYGRFYNPGEKK